VFNKSVKLLIVEGNDSMRDSLSRIFSDLGYQVRTGADGSSGLSEMRREIPDVLLADLNMARIPGLEFLMVVRRWLPSIRVIALSDLDSGNLVPPGVVADALLRKAASPAGLIRTVAAMIHPNHSTCRLSMENSLGFRVLEAIPPHPNIEQLTFPARREMSFPLSRTERRGKMFLVQAIDPTQTVRAS